MVLTFINTNLEKFYQVYSGAKIISSHKTWLGGCIHHLLLNYSKQAFMKIGTNFERVEMNRQYKNISFLQSYLPAPQTYNYASNKFLAAIVLEKMPVSSLHTMLCKLDRHSIFSIIKNILTILGHISNSIKKNL